MLTNHVFKFNLLSLKNRSYYYTHRVDIKFVYFAQIFVNDT
jgi:hypothetical protein